MKITEGSARFRVTVNVTAAQVRCSHRSGAPDAPGHLLHEHVRNENVFQCGGGSASTSARSSPQHRQSDGRRCFGVAAATK
jgi:hypothetical protein